MLGSACILSKSAIWLPTGEGSSSNNVAAPFSGTTHAELKLTYVRPTEKIKIRNYLFDAFGPYPIAGAAILGAINQAHNTPPEWGQGFKAYGERVGSDFGIALATTTTRYALAEAFREDTIYYRCECKGIVRRMQHAVISDGRRHATARTAIVACHSPPS